MVRFRKPCEHGRYEYHVEPLCKHGKTHMHASSEWGCAGPDHCSGGEFLSDDALIIERESDGKFPEWITDVDGPVWFQCGGTDDLLEDIFEAIKASRPQSG